MWFQVQSWRRFEWSHWCCAHCSCFAYSWKGACFRSYSWSSTHTYSWPEKSRGHDAITSSSFGFDLQSDERAISRRVWRKMWRDIHLWRWLESPCSYLPSTLLSWEVPNTLSLGRVYITWSNLIISCRIELSIRYLVSVSLILLDFLFNKLSKTKTKKLISPLLAIKVQIWSRKASNCLFYETEISTSAKQIPI